MAAQHPAYPAGVVLSTVLRTVVTVTGSYVASPGVLRDTSYIARRSFSANYNIDLQAEAPWITGTHLLLSIQLCDCAECETAVGTGRCVRFGPIPVDVAPPAAAALGSGTMGGQTGAILPATLSRSITP